jgi:hypothetical protein
MRLRLPASRRGSVPQTCGSNDVVFFAACKTTGKTPPLSNNPHSCFAAVLPEKGTVPSDQQNAMH